MIDRRSKPSDSFEGTLYGFSPIKMITLAFSIVVVFFFILNKMNERKVSCRLTVDG